MSASDYASKTGDPLLNELIVSTTTLTFQNFLYASVDSFFPDGNAFGDAEAGVEGKVLFFVSSDYGRCCGETITATIQGLFDQMDPEFWDGIFSLSLFKEDRFWESPLWTWQVGDLPAATSVELEIDSSYALYITYRNSCAAPIHIEEQEENNCFSSSEVGLEITIVETPYDHDYDHDEDVDGTDLSEIVQRIMAGYYWDAEVACRGFATNFGKTG